jgi:hypothetical protein
VFHKGAFVAAGTGPCSMDTATVVLRSTDGVSWLRATGYVGVNGFYGMTTSPDYVMGVGWGWTRSLSSNGLHWVFVDDTFGVHLKAVAYGEGRYVAVGHDFFTQNTGRILSSTNGFNWSAATFLGNPTNQFIGVAFGNGTFRAITPTRNYTSDTNATNFLNAGYSSQNRLICFGNGRFIRVSDQLHVYARPTPADPVSWVLTPWPTAIPFERIAFGAGMFLATAGRDVATSTNGFDWTVRTNALPRAVLDVAFGTSLVMAVAGTNYYTAPIASLAPTATPGAVWLHGITAREYDILATNSVTTSNWPVVTRLTLTNSPQLWTDPNGPPSNGARFYRSRLVP